MAKNNYLAIVTADTGFETAYVSFKDRVARDGALSGTPTVTVTGSVFSISNTALNGTTQIAPDGVSHAAGELLSFRVTAATGSDGVVETVSVAFTTALTDGQLDYSVKKAVGG